ncbi:DUF916 domain-containing protein [Streptomyces sp. NPDC051940]|uniref:WxL protein peptidoglycan domain-containing protein n=1 Tax=Streptomyces sp. NPDC051940 TaxID=3155675 RepID=UPI003436EBA6
MRKPLYAVLAALFLGLLATLAPAAHAADNGRWSVFPYAPEGAGPRPYFVLKADRGTVLKDTVVLSNLSDEPTTFTLYAADAYNTPRDGGFAVRTKDVEPRYTGKWVELPKTEITLPPHKKVSVPFTLSIPNDATPGDHPGAIVALDQRVDASSGAVGVGVQRAVAARIYLHVNGPLIPGLHVDDVTIRDSRPLLPGTGDSLAVIEYTLVNGGNTILRPRVTLKAEGLFGRTLLERELKKVPAELLPGERVRLTERWRGSPQLDWGEVRIAVSDRNGEPRAEGTAGFLYVPWLVAGVLLAAVGGAVTWFVHRRRQRRPAARPARPAAREPEPETAST